MKNTTLRRLLSRCTIPRFTRVVPFFTAALAAIPLLLGLALPTASHAQQLRALVVVSNGANPIASDAAVGARLQTLGFQVTFIGAPQVTTNDAAGMDLVVTLASVQSSDLRNKFATFPVPVLNSEQAALDNDYRMSEGGRGTSTGQTQIDIVNADHQLAAGLSGRITVYSPAEGVTRGTPRADTAIIIARSLDQPTQSCIFGYEAGAEMYSPNPGAGDPPLVAPARRLHFMLSDNSFLNLTPEGLRLFDAAVRWLANLSTEEEPPRITNLSPVAGALFQPTSVPVGFTATTHPANTIPAGEIQMTLNGVDVSGQLTVGGTASERTVTYTGSLTANTLYTVEVRVTDNSGRESFRIWNFDTLNAESTRMIEAEDFNFSGGNYINNPVPTMDFEGPNTYYGQGYATGMPGVDFNELNPTVRPPVGTEWRDFGFEPPLPQTEMNTDFVRQKYQAEGAAADFDLINLVAGEWANYTRDFAPGNYRIFLRASAAATQTVQLHRVTSDRAQPDQTSVLLGNFSAVSGGGYRFIPLAQPGTSDAAVVSISGVQTLRLLALTANNNLDLNYIMLVPTTDPATPIGPYVDSVSPARNSTTALRTSISATLINRETTVNTGTVQLTVDGTVVTSGVTVTPTAAGADVSYAVSPPFGPASTHTVVLSFNDNMGNSFSNSWSFTTTPDALPVFTAPRIENGELKLVVGFAAPVTADTAGNVANYSSSDGVTFSQAAVLATRAVELTGTAAAEGQDYSLTVQNLQDTLGNPVPATTLPYNVSAFLQDSAGLIAIEAESYHTNSPGTDIHAAQAWNFSTDWAGYAGAGSMRGLGGGGVALENTALAARMDYRVRFTQAGAYMLWIRGTELSSADSLYYGIDGNYVAAVGGIAVGPFNWASSPEDETTLGANRFTITEPGEYTLNLWVREAGGMYLDRIVIAPEDSGFNPVQVNNGQGPDQSARAGSVETPDRPVLQFSQPTASQIQFNWTGTGFRLQQAASLTGPWGDVPNGSTPPVTVTTSGSQMFFQLISD